MDRNLITFLQGRLDDRDAAGPGKVMELSEAVRRFVRPGMSIHHGGFSFPAAAYYEIARQFWGKAPGFTLIGNSGGAYNFALFAFGKLCRKIISGFNGDGYPFPGPNPILARALREGSMIAENWTFLTVTLRLMAGAMGLPFFPTHSLLGSSLEQDNPESFCRMPSPFADGETIGLLRSLNPDISLAHGWAADPEGNTLLGSPWSANHYGSLAAREGTLVTVERIVDSEFIRRHSHLTKIPGYAVKAVCPVTMGSHPTGLHAHGIPEFEGYGEDEEFILEARKASKDPEQYRAWVEKWVLGCRDHEDFLALLGQRRVWFLKGRIQNDSWVSELSDYASRLQFPVEATDAERLVHAGSLKIRELVEAKGHRLLLCGIGVSNLASWSAFYDLRSRGNPLQLVAEVGFYGYVPQPADPFVFNLRNVPSSGMITDIFTTLGMMMSGKTPCMGVLGAGQVDRFGNVNTTRLSDEGPHLVGSGGANDVASTATEIVVTLEQSRSRFVENVPYVTSPGDRVTTVVSQFGIFEKAPGRNGLILTAYYPDGSEEESLRAIQEHCGWELKVARPLRILAPPSPDEVKFIRCFDPKRLFLGGTESVRREHGGSR
ncbi:MAG TPA: CoA-transferase [Syntrophales bacterium]|nr:CoA-transferase [Syntrophales bacterium]